MGFYPLRPVSGSHRSSPANESKTFYFYNNGDDDDYDYGDGGGVDVAACKQP